MVNLCLSSPIIRGGNNLEFFGKLSSVEIFFFSFFFISSRRIIIGTFLEISKRSVLSALSFRIFRNCRIAMIDF